MPDFLVLSIGRTATRWLANTLGVDHEPKDFTGRACSPLHLFLMTEGWEIPLGVMRIVMVRNAHLQMLSILNRAEALGRGKLDLFRQKIDRYLNILNGLVKEGALVVSFEELTSMEPEQLAAWALDTLGIDSITPSPPANQHPKVLNSLPQWAIVCAEKMQRHYDAWMTGRALEFDPDEPDPTRHEIRYQGNVYRMDYVFPAEIAALRTKKHGLFQEIPVLEWVRHLGWHGTFIDCGAHVGNHSLYFANHCFADQVVAIEAHPKIFKLMRGNLLRNVAKPSKLVMINKAVWRQGGETVTMGPIPHNNAGHTCLQPGGPTAVTTMTLDELDFTAPPAVLKIDVEDVEEDVILGARKLLSEHHPVLIAERHSKMQLDNFEKLIEPYGYTRAMEWGGIHTYAWI